MGVKAKSNREQTESKLLAGRLAAGFRFYVVEQHGVRLPVLARCTNQAMGVFIAWQKFAVKSLVVSNEPFACIGIYEVLPAEYNHYAVYCGRRKGMPYIKVVAHHSQG